MRPFVKEVHAQHSQFNDVGGNQIINYSSPRSVFELLKEHTAFNTAYNSSERESEHASTCQEGTRTDVIEKISAWSKANNLPPICWLQGPAGSGKSTIAHTIAERCDNERTLVFSFFFSRGKHDRSDTTKFVPTFAYQLAKSFPAIQAPMQQALIDDPSIPSQRLNNQIRKLIVDPTLKAAQPIPTMIAVIDGLDECGDDVLLQELIKLLVDTTNRRLPFRFLFTSRPEIHIQQTFESPVINRKTYFLALRDFSADDDIRKYLRVRLSDIAKREILLMRDVPKPWPSQKDLKKLVEQSEGLFIYVSTLVGFVADGTGHPQQKLQALMQLNKGVDPLYHQVLCKAREFKDFERVVGAIVYVRAPLSIRALGRLLQLDSSHIRIALRGCQSIFTIPDVDSDSVRPYHASLRDYLTDPIRANDQFLDPMKCHIFILIDCVKLITNVEEGSWDVGYACEHWCYHLSSALQHSGAVGFVESYFGDGVVTFVRKIEKEWLKLWISSLDGKNALETVCRDSSSALCKMQVGLLY